MSMGSEREPRPARGSRARDGRVLGGVCAGLHDVRGLGTNGWRAVFILAALCGGIGIIAYIACWLVIPEAGESADTETVRGIVVLAWASGGLIAVVLVAAMSATVTVFGLGWVVVALAGVVLVLALGPLSRRIPAFVGLSAVAALTLPAMAVALSPVRISLQDGALVSRPSSYLAINRTVFRSGFGTQLIDLRRTRFPATGPVTLRIDAGLRRTIVALPSNTCVHVTVDYSVHPFAGRLATLVSGRQQTPFDGIVLFGDVYGAPPNQRAGVVSSRGTSTGPLLRIDFSSQGGSLYVRDYPNDVPAETDPDWPGYRVTPEPRPNLTGETHKAAKLMLKDWHQRLRQDVANEQLVNRLIPGPCTS